MAGLRDRCERLSARPAAAVGCDLITGVDWCASCDVLDRCTLVGRGRPELEELHRIVVHGRVLRPGERLFRRGDPFETLFAVRTGAVKTVHARAAGAAQVRGFFFPGDAVGLDSVGARYYLNDAIALEQTRICGFPFVALRDLAARKPAVLKHLFEAFAGNPPHPVPELLAQPTEQRLARFLLALYERQAVHGDGDGRLHLSMTRRDIASYLCMAPETVSRALRRFGDQGWIEQTGRREIRLLDLPGLVLLVRGAQHGGGAGSGP